MTAFIAANLAPIMFASLVIFLLFGYPVAFGLAACGIFYALVGIEVGALPPSLFQALPLRIFGVMGNDTLLAIPFFTFMGLILERSGMAEDLLETIGQLFGPIRGGLAFAVIFVGAMLAATTGVVAASVISMGLISLPIMLRYGYDRRVASGVIAASGTLAQIIPPSLVLIVLADQLGKSVGDMYKGAFIPGFMLTGLYAIFIVGIALFRPQWAPALPPEARSQREANGSSGVISLLVLVAISVVASVVFAKRYPDSPFDEMLVSSLFFGVGVAFFIALIDKMLKINMLSEVARKVTFVMIPPLALIFLVLGTIFLGIATPTEGGAMGAAGAMIMAMMRKRLTWSLLRQAMDTTAKLATFVVFILLGSTTFNLVFQGVDGSKWVEHLLLGLPGGQLGFLIVVNVLVFVLAFFLDFFELAFIIVPLVGPVAEKLGIDLIWFGVLLGVNMQTSFMHPPFGFALFYLRSVAAMERYKDRITGKMMEPVTTGQIYWGAVPYVFIQVFMVGLIIAFPGLVSGGLEKQKEVDLEKFRIEMPKGPSDAPAEKNLNELFNIQAPKGDSGGAAPAAAPGSAAPGAGGSTPGASGPSLPTPAAEAVPDPTKSMLDALKREEAGKK